MGSDSADEIRRRMALIRTDLRSDVQTLLQNAKVKTDWRHYVKQYPWLSIGAAALLGIWLAPKAAAKKLAFDPELLNRLRALPLPPPAERGKSFFGLIAGTLVPLVTRFAVSKLMAYFMEVEKPEEVPAESVPLGSFGRYPKPK